MSSRRAREVSSVFITAPHRSHLPPELLTPVRSAVALDSHNSVNATVNCTCEGSRLLTLYENLMLDLMWN